MPAERFDAIVIGATIDGLGCALSLALSGKKVVCADKKLDVSHLGQDKAVWLSHAACGQLGLAGHGLATGAPIPQMTIAGKQSRVVWPDLDLTHRALQAAGPGDADRFVETIRFLQRQLRVMADPGAAVRGALAVGAHTFAGPWEALELGQFLARDIHSFLGERLDDPTLTGLLNAIAVLHAPVSPDGVTSALALLNTAKYFHAPIGGERPATGGEKAVILALVSALVAAGGQVDFGAEVREILTERETASGVALTDGRVWQAPYVVAAIAPRRLAQGLLNTRRSGRQLTALASTSRQSVASARFYFPETPLEQVGGARAFPDGVALWVGAEPKRVLQQARAYQRRQTVDEPLLCLTLEPGSQRAAVLAPLTPPEPAEGTWTEGRREALLEAMVRTLNVHAPALAGQLLDAELVSPRAPAQLGGTGAIFGGGARLPDIETMFGFRGEPMQPLLKGVYLCAASVLEPGMAGGLSAAQSVISASHAKQRA
jgi:phytoene dehydrogenase-like protein